MNSFSTSSLIVRSRMRDGSCRARSRSARSWSGTLPALADDRHTHTHTDAAGVSFARGCRYSPPSAERACIACDSPRGVSMVAKDDPIHLMIRRATCSVDEPSARGRGARRELEVQLFNAVNDANYCCKYERVISIYNPNNNNADIACIIHEQAFLFMVNNQT